MGEQRHPRAGSRRGTDPDTPSRGHRRSRPGGRGSYRRAALVALAAGAVLASGGALAATLPEDPLRPRQGPAAPAAPPAAGPDPPRAEAPSRGSASTPPAAPTTPTTPAPASSPTRAGETSAPSPTPGRTSPLVRRYEAELAELSGFVRIFPLPRASGGAVVGLVGQHRDSEVVFREVVVEAAGEYELTVHYVSPQERTALVGVNGADPERLDFPGQGDGHTVGEVSVTVTLEEGENEIRIGNPEARAPSLDLITVTG